MNMEKAIKSIRLPMPTFLPSNYIKKRRKKKTPLIRHLNAFFFAEALEMKTEKPRGCQK